MSLLVFIFLLIVLGIANAAYLHLQYLERQKTGKPMICPFGGHCELVVESKYGTTLGIKNERWGIAYYLIIVLLLIISLTVSAFDAEAKFVMLLLSLLVAIFSTYLLWAQLFIIKDYCSWCIAAHLINYAIFISLLFYLY